MVSDNRCATLLYAGIFRPGLAGMQAIGASTAQADPFLLASCSGTLEERVGASTAQADPFLLASCSGTLEERVWG